MFFVGQTAIESVRVSPPALLQGVNLQEDGFGRIVDYGAGVEGAEAVDYVDAVSVAMPEHTDAVPRLVAVESAVLAVKGVGVE